MSVHTDYDAKRDYLRAQLNECLSLAKEMFDEDIWGYGEMSEDYIIDVYQAIKKVRDMI